jgi:hypothetical protein
MGKNLQTMVKQLSTIDRQLEKLPEGKLITSKDASGNNIRFLVRQDESKKYISRDDMQFVRKLALKKYLILRAKELKKLIYAEALAEKAKHDFQLSMNKIMGQNSNYRNVIIEAMSMYDENEKEWSKLIPESNPYRSDDKTVPTLSGITVRSKSESMIANELFRNNIPFKYEVAIDLGGKIVFPDFAILSQKESKIIFWEHWGLFDQEDYRRHTYEKISLYSDAGIFPNDKLIMTYEGRKNPLDINNVRDIILNKFL